MSREFTGRREDRRLVTGQGRYTTDHTLPGQTHGAFVRADRGHAVIRGIDASAALAAPGVLAVLTGQDVIAAGYEGAGRGMVVVNRQGEPMKTPHRGVITADKVRFVGDLVALVVAETRDQAEDAAELVMIDYEDLPCVTRPEQSMAPGAPLLHESAPGNLGLTYDYGDAAATDAAFAAAAHVAKVTVDAQRMSGNPMEPKSCLVGYDPQTGAYDLYLPNQGLNPMRLGLRSMTGVPVDKLILHPIDVGGAFGVRSEAYAEYAAVMLAAKTVGRPVKWTGSRNETIMSDHQGRGARLTGEMALDKDGRFLAVRIDWLVDAGAYWASAGAAINALLPSSMAVGVYDIPVAYGVSRLYFTNACPTTAYRGASRPNASYLLERLVDEAARITGLDPVDIRRRNLIPRSAFPFQTPTGSVYDSGDPDALLRSAADKADWTGFEARRREAAARGKLRGLGVAVFISPSGGPGKEQGIITFDGEGFPLLLSLAGPSGQGHETAFPEVVGQILGIDPDSITLRYGDPADPAMEGTGSFGSRSLISHGGALLLAAETVVKKGAALAADLLDAPEDEIDFEDGLYRRRGGNASVTLLELMKRHAGESPHPLESLGDLKTEMAWPSGAHVAEVEIDPDTGVLQIIRYTAVDDCGLIINHTLVEGQMHGGVMQGLGQVLGEHCIYDEETGQLLTGSFMDYFMPHARDAFPLDMYDLSVLAPGNPLGAKGAGEAGTTGAIPTLANAVIDALSPLGVTHLDMPFSPNRVWTAIQAAKAGQAA